MFHSPFPSKGSSCGFQPTDLGQLGALLLFLFLCCSSLLFAFQKISDPSLVGASILPLLFQTKLVSKINHAAGPVTSWLRELGHMWLTTQSESQPQWLENHASCVCPKSRKEGGMEEKGLHTLLGCFLTRAHVL